MSGHAYNTSKRYAFLTLDINFLHKATCHMPTVKSVKCVHPSLTKMSTQVSTQVSTQAIFTPFKRHFLTIKKGCEKHPLTGRQASDIILYFVPCGVAIGVEIPPVAGNMWPRPASLPFCAVFRPFRRVFRPSTCLPLCWL